MYTFFVDAYRLISGKSKVVVPYQPHCIRDRICKTKKLRETFSRLFKISREFNPEEISFFTHLLKNKVSSISIPIVFADKVYLWITPSGMVVLVETQIKRGILKTFYDANQPDLHFLATMCVVLLDQD